MSKSVLVVFALLALTAGSLSAATVVPVSFGSLGINTQDISPTGAPYTLSGVTFSGAATMASLGSGGVFSGNDGGLTLDFHYPFYNLTFAFFVTGAGITGDVTDAALDIVSLTSAGATYGGNNTASGTFSYTSVTPVSNAQLYFATGAEYYGITSMSYTADVPEPGTVLFLFGGLAAIGAGRLLKSRAKRLA